VGADLVYSEAVVEKLCKTVVALGCSRVYYCAPATGRAGSPQFLARLEALGFTRTTEDAPASYSEAPCEGAALYFPDLANSSFQLHMFARQEPATASYQAMSYLVREDRKHGKLARGGHGKPAALPPKLRKPTSMPKKVSREEIGIPDDPSPPLPPKRHPHNPTLDDTPESLAAKRQALLDDAVRKTGLPVAGEPIPSFTGPSKFGVKGLTKK
jgi:hypothetical protein